MTTLRELEKDVLNELQSALEDFAEVDNGEVYFNTDIHDLIFEIADSNTPIYTYNILELGSDNLFLAMNTPELGPAFDGAPTPVNIIAANIFEHLESTMWDKVEEIKQEIEEELEAEEDDLE